ncbi:MAG TPA: gamma-glutamyl-gamma-aminobutyrate hydrolase family protein [Gaiellales bacterium]|nr:gamma-glutamyl-gamma-aminobutyrate hydrolase family protein [Gaiellales bacterium]
MHRNRPLIGITAYEVPASFAHWRDMPTMMVPAGYAHAVSAAGGMPVVIPPSGGASELLGRVDGLVFSGGSDIDPELYGQPPQPETGPVVRHRDEAEIELMGAAIERGVPVLGVCRGMQLLNIVRGGTLAQHLAESPPVVHKGPPGTFTTHDVSVELGTRLHDMVGDALAVHSCHHQGVDRLGEGLVVTAHAPDGVIEGIETGGERFAVGVLWHPEEHAELGGPLFRGLVEAASPAA